MPKPQTSLTQNLWCNHIFSGVQVNSEDSWSRLKSFPVYCTNIGALIIRIGFWKISYKTYNTEPPKIKSIGSYLGPYSIRCEKGCGGSGLSNGHDAPAQGLATRDMGASEIWGGGGGGFRV